ncbi:pyruvate kinase [Candidatus Saccharibacteria bacterium]|nr:pyruvate kinase [Candidatus Saccharibacteria bacterium]
MESNKTIKRTKILATIGPAVDSPEKIAALIDAGVNGCRMNFSHGDEEERLNQFKWVREYSAKIGRHIAIIQDLQGPKIRIGQLKDNMRYDIHTGDVIGFTYDIEHDGGNNLPSQYDISDKCEPGDAIYLFDGKIKTIVQHIEDKTVWTRAENDGYVVSRKAINLPDIRGSHSDILTEKDLVDIEWGLDKDFDYTALSFVHHADDVRMLRELLKSKGVDRPIITKLETKSGASPENLEDIVKASDGVMVARGDLAVEVGAEVVPVVQRQIIALCQKHCKFSIVATQMLASMVDSPEPTRAEISDVATASIEGADVVMLSEETAMGKYPIEAVTAMRETILYAQKHLPVTPPLYACDNNDKRRDPIAESAVLLAKRTNAAAILVETQSGKMVRSVSNHRPKCPIIAVATTDRMANQVELTYNTRGFYGGVGEGYVVAEKLFDSGLFGEEPVTVVMVRHNLDGAPIHTANTIQLYLLGDSK